MAGKALQRLEIRLRSENEVLASGEAVCYGEALVEQWRQLLRSMLDLALAHTLA